MSFGRGTTRNATVERAIFHSRNFRGRDLTRLFLFLTVGAVVVGGGTGSNESESGCVRPSNRLASPSPLSVLFRPFADLGIAKDGTRTPRRKNITSCLLPPPPHCDAGAAADANLALRRSSSFAPHKLNLLIFRFRRCEKDRHE